MGSHGSAKRKKWASQALPSSRQSRQTQNQPVQTITSRLNHRPQCQQHRSSGILDHRHIVSAEPESSDAQASQEADNAAIHEERKDRLHRLASTGHISRSALME